MSSSMARQRSLKDRLLGLPGHSLDVQSPPETCMACGSKHLYRQADFNRNIGLWLVGIASVLTVLFAIQGQNWFITWSPMVAFLFLDRFFAWSRPEVVICYQCETLHRGLSRQDCERYEHFDLEKHDRLHYAERVGGEP